MKYTWYTFKVVFWSVPSLSSELLTEIQPTQIRTKTAHDIYYSREFIECNMKYYVTEYTYTTYYDT